MSCSDCTHEPNRLLSQPLFLFVFRVSVDLFLSLLPHSIACIHKITLIKMKKYVSSITCKNVNYVFTFKETPVEIKHFLNVGTVLREWILQ